MSSPCGNLYRHVYLCIILVTLFVFALINYADVYVTSLHAIPVISSFVVVCVSHVNPVTRVRFKGTLHQHRRAQAGGKDFYTRLRVAGCFFFFNVLVSVFLERSTTMYIHLNSKGRYESRERIFREKGEEKFCLLIYALKKKLR